MQHDDNNKEEDDDDDDVVNQSTSLVQRFDEICFSIGDCDAIEVVASNDDTTATGSTSTTAVCYFELQEHSKSLASQIYHRYHPTYVLIDCQGWAVPEVVATLACMRLQIPFVPVSCYDQHRPGRLENVVNLLLQLKNTTVIAVTVCDNDRDPILSVFQQAGVHQILYLDAATGGLKEQLNVPEEIPAATQKKDDLYVLFTSGTSSSTPKAVIGSHSATFRRIHWFLDQFPSSPRIGRRSKLSFVDGVNELLASLLDPNSILVSVPPRELQSHGIASIYDKCTQLLLLPSQLNQLLLLRTPSKSLERVLISGEVCSSMLVKSFTSSYKSCELINLYGQTESTGDVCCAVLVSNDASSSSVIIDNCVAIGKPILDSIEIVLNDKQELILRGPDQLANGYLKSDGNNPFTSFSTGDVGFCKDGVWYVKGRLDDVVKINGIWTSPTEMEIAFCQVHNEMDGVVVAVLVETCFYILCSNEQICQLYSRTHMHLYHGIPWNLIPTKVFFCPIIPTTVGGAAKINRVACRDIALDRLEQSKNSSAPSKDPKVGEFNFLSTVAKVLGIQDETLNPSKSFVELGGDSAKSITLLYLLRSLDGGFNVRDVTAMDLLNAKSLIEFQERLLSGRKYDPSTKRQKVASPPRVDFKPHTAVLHSARHQSIQLQACVDATPLVVDNKSIVVACQGGVILKCDREGTILGFTHLYGWMIQADLLHIKNKASRNVIVTGAHSLEGKGLVVAFSTDLKIEIWKKEMGGAVKATPVLIDDNLWILQTDGTVSVLNATTGVCDDCEIKLKLPHPSTAKPAIFQNEQDNCQCLAYASSDWESCLMIVDTAKGTVQKALDYEIGPVHKDLCTLNDDGMVMLSDSYGAMHLIDLPNLSIVQTHKLSGNPLAPPLSIGENMNKQSFRVVVGGYDGMVHCVTENGVNWKSHVGAAVYSKAAIRMSQIVVSTTAGDLVAINALTGTIEWKDHIPAEIWSDLIVTDDDEMILFGARDSRLHFVYPQNNSI